MKVGFLAVSRPSLFVWTFLLKKQSPAKENQHEKRPKSAVSGRFLIKMINRLGGWFLLVKRTWREFHLRAKAAKVVFSLAEALLYIERGKKNAALAAFDLNGIGGAGGYCLPVQTVTGT